jgi:hypothetical protein
MWRSSSKRTHGGRQAFEGLTADDVCQKIVKPMTERLQCSYVDLLRTIQHPAYWEGKKADVFVSLAINCLFLDVVVDTLLSQFFNCLDSIMVRRLNDQSTYLQRVVELRSNLWRHSKYRIHGHGTGSDAGSSQSSAVVVRALLY